jgi:DNA-binding NtrC family response regulator
MRAASQSPSTDTSHAERRANEASQTARVFIEEPGLAPRVVLLPRGRDVRAGRGEELEIVLADRRVSRCHVILRHERLGVLVRDAGSSNGTFLGERKLEAPATVGAGTVVRVGDSRLVISLPVEEEPSPEGAPEAMIAVDPASVQLRALVRRVAASAVPVLIQGETGTGKELVAQELHRASARSQGPFVAVNCAALPESIAESELFGHEKGSFTGAQGRRAGVFEQAHGGTLLLDEVGELSASNQARLLRVLQERVLVRVGGDRSIPVDVRIVAATNRDLAVSAARREFREDLYFRLNGITLEVLPLRCRTGDVLPLAERFITELGFGLRLGPGVGVTLQAHRWPGNVRELRHAIAHAVALAEGPEILLEHLPTSVRGAARAPLGDGSLRDRMDDLERQSIVAALAASDGNQSRTARLLGLSRRALIYKMERYGLKPPPGSRS